MKAEPETKRQMSYRLIIGQYSNETKTGELNSVLDENERLLRIVERLRGAINALTHPDGVIRGPLIDGPELDELNESLAYDGRPDDE